LAVILCSFFFMFQFQTEQADDFLFGGETVTQGELVAIEAAFGKAGLSKYEIIGNKVKVPRLQRDKYLAALADNSALPQSFGSALQNMFNSDSPFDTRDIRERKAVFAQENELSKIIRALPDIREATVKIQELPAATFGGAKDRRALVAVKSVGTKSIDTAALAIIRQTVASGAGVKPEFVTVTDLNGHVSPGTGKGNGASEFDNLYAANQQIFVDQYTKTIREHLSIYPGVQVAVHVELDKQLLNEMSSIKYDEKPTSIETNTLTKESNSNSGEGGGRPGAQANGALGNAPAQVQTASTNESTQTESREGQKNVVGTTHSTSQMVPLSPTSVSVSIGIPTSYFTKVWHMRNPAAPGEDPKTPPAAELETIKLEKKAEIEELVVGLLPRVPKGDDKYIPVKVVPYDETPVAEIESPTLAATTFDWFAENWQTLGLFGLALFGAVLLRGMIRSAAQALPATPVETKDQRATAAEALEQEELALSDGEEETAANTLKKRFQSTGRGLRDELTELVREDPDAAASVLKLWISNAA
jgi:flagellar M-ring protein FliF